MDAHLWPRRFSSAQLFGVHLVRAQPLLSIRDRPDLTWEGLMEEVVMFLNDDYDQMISNDLKFY